MAVVSREIARSSEPTTAERANGLDLALQIVAYVVLIAVALLMFTPFLFSVTTSFKTAAEASQVNTLTNLLWPDDPTFSAYREVFEADIGRWFFNSAFVAAIWVVGRAVTDSMAGYAFARMTFPGRNLIFLMVLSTLMIPAMVTIIPKFILLERMGLLDTYGALTIPFLSSAFGIFLMKQFFESIPVELEEAARVDGASRYRMFTQIVLPNSMPALTALAIFSFQGSWNAFLEPLLFVTSPDLRTLPLWLAYFQEAFNFNWPVSMAIAVITTLPMAIVFLFFQRYFVEGQTTSGIKG